MSEKEAKEPFRFFTTSSLVEITGKKARHLKEFVRILKEIDSSSIFYHMHRSFREYTFAPGQYSNDFARWASDDLEESKLAERLASIDIQEFTDLESLRAKLMEIIEEHLSQAIEIRKTAPGREFYFLRGIEIVTPTAYEVFTLKEFAETLNLVGMRSLYFHFFDARLRLGRKTNDFSNWIRHNLGEEEIAKKINALDPYFITMDQLKQKIIGICRREEKKEFKFWDILGTAKKFMGRK
jgi:hypothetical protein